MLNDTMTQAGFAYNICFVVTLLDCSSLLHPWHFVGHLPDYIIPSTWVATTVSVMSLHHVINAVQVCV